MLNVTPLNKIAILFALILTFLVRPAYAADYFFDDFSGSILDNWLPCTLDNCNSWSVQNGFLTGTVSNGNSSVLQGRWDYSNSGNYRLESDVKNISGVDQIFFVRLSEDRSKYYQIDFRYNELNYDSGDKNNITLYKYDSGYTFLDSYPSVLVDRDFDITQNVTHHVEILVDGRRINVFFDGNLVIDYVDNDSPILGGGIGLLNWSGACPGLITNSFDFIRVSPLNGSIPTPTPTLTPINTPSPTPTITPSPTPTSTPTSVPTVEPRQKIIFIPGLGASWNTEALVYNTNVSDDQWTMTPFVNNYNSFFKALEDNGYRKSRDYYVWNYDWRRPVSEIVGKLDSFINHNIGTSDKFSIVGHSLGGVVGRIWLSDHKNDSRINQVMALGSPQSGSIDAYTLWNGGVVSGNDDVASSALNILIQLQKKNSRTKVEVIRNYTPVFRDLLPIFNFIKKENRVVSYQDLTFKNNYLSQKKIPFGNIFSKYQAVAGVGINTVEWLTLERSNNIDKMLGQWPDGRMIQKSKPDYSVGDGTVLLKSAATKGDGFLTVSSNHGQVVDKALSKILESLSLNKVDKLDYFGLNNKKIYFMGSPAKIVASCGKNKFESDSFGFLLLDKNHKCNIKVVGTGGGVFHLVIGQAGSKDWSYFESEIKKDEVLDLSKKETWLKIIIRDLRLLNIKFHNNETLKDIFRYRKNNNEVVVTDRLIDSFVEYKLLSDNNYGGYLFEAYRKLKVAEYRYNRSYRPNLTFIDAINYQKSDELLEGSDDRSWVKFQLADELDD